MLTAVNDANTAALCMQRGAMDYLVKPVDLQDLERAIGRALARRRDLIEQAETQAWLKQEIVQRGAELRRERGNLERISVATLEALVNALEAKDAYLRGHSARVADLSAMIAAEMGLSDEQIEMVRTAGRLHDIGKIGIREAVLHKHGPLSEEEFDHVKTHVLIGAQILAPLHHLREVISYVRSHHERHDGTGYPDGLVGEAIPIGARILGRGRGVRRADHVAAVSGEDESGAGGVPDARPRRHGDLAGCASGAGGGDHPSPGVGLPRRESRALIGGNRVHHAGFGAEHSIAASAICRPMTRGVTLLELLLVLVLVGILAGLAIPRLGAVASAAALRHEATELVVALDAARLDAIRFGAVDSLTLSDSSYRLELLADGDTTLRWQHAGAGTRGVQLSGGGAPIHFGAAGLAVGVSNRTLTFTRLGASRRVVISRLGRITP